ncbi:MAG: hypothetical protein AAGF01_11715 [Cyanobacteria bacterium P01_G01_bin.38]
MAMKEPFIDSKVTPQGLATSPSGENLEAELTHQPEPLAKRLRVIAMILTATGLACLWVLLFALPAQG